MTLLRKQRRKVITGISALVVAIAMPVAWFLFLESQHQMRFHPVGGGTWYEQPAYVIIRGFFAPVAVMSFLLLMFGIILLVSASSKKPSE